MKRFDVFALTNWSLSKGYCGYFCSSFMLRKSQYTNFVIFTSSRRNISSVYYEKTSWPFNRSNNWFGISLIIYTYAYRRRWDSRNNRLTKIWSMAEGKHENVIFNDEQASTNFHEDVISTISITNSIMKMKWILRSLFSGSGARLKWSGAKCKL